MARYERFSLPPRSVGIPGQKPRLSMIDRQIAAVRIEQERQAMAIRTREELHADLTDFSYIPLTDEFGLPQITPYQVPEGLPDVLPLPEKNVPPEESNNDKDESQGDPA